LLRFWPESGRTQVLPATVQFTDMPTVRAFPDGREIAVFGLPANTSGPPRPFALNLQSLAVRDLSSGLKPETLRAPIAVTEDGRSVPIQRRRDDTMDTLALPRSGSAPVQTLISLPYIVAPLSQDVAPDGSLYMDQPQSTRSILNLSPSGSLLAEVPFPIGLQTVVGLAEGAFVFSVARRGRSDLFLGRIGAEPQLLLNSPESASLPGALLAGGNLAFIVGAADQPRIAIASLRDGRIVRQFPADARRVSSITAPADGETLYYASDGIVWAQPVSGGDPRKIGEGYQLAVEPSGKSLYLARTGEDGYRLFRMPAAG
jgi:hypothetical protein